MAVRAHHQRRLRAIKMMEAKALENMTTAEVAERFKVSPDTVERTLAWAERAEIFANYEDKILSGLVPKAFRAVESALEDGNAKVALEILKGTRLLRTSDKAASSEQRQADDDLAAYIAAKRDVAQKQLGTIEAEVLEGPHEQRQLTAGDAGPDSSGHAAGLSGQAPLETAASSAESDGSGALLAPDATHPNAPAHTGPVDTGV